MKARIYEATVCPMKMRPIDDGLTVKIQLPARDRKQAARRVAVLIPNAIVTDLRCAGVSA